MSKHINLTSKKLLNCLILLLVTLSWPLLAASQHITWATYTNARFDYAIQYPVNILIPQGESANRDGQRFVSSDARAILTVWGSHNALDQPLAENFQESLAGFGGRVTYQVLKPTWFVFSGYRNDTILYQKTYLLDGIYKTFTLEYPRDQRELFDPLTTVIARSFTGR